MIRKALAATTVLVIALTACTRSGTGASSSPNQVYASVLSESDVRGLLGSQDWWESTPSFGVRPLGLPTMSESVKFSITSRYVHVGTPEFFIADYTVFDTIADATAQLTNVSNNFPNSATTPRAGDQALYTGERVGNNTALYSNLMYVRVGQILISAEWDRDQGFTNVQTMAKIANALANKLKDVTNGKVKPSPVASADTKLLPPPGSDITLVGAARLPVEAAVASLGVASPTEAVGVFHQFGVKDFVYGDYALDADLSMEVRALVFSFGSPDDASQWIDSFVGSSNLDAQGVLIGYSNAGFYYAFFTGGMYGAILFCNALDPFEAASRACEAPLTRVVGSWLTSLNGGVLPTPVPSPSSQTTPTGA